MKRGRLIGLLIVLIILSILFWNRLYVHELEKVSLTGRATDSIGTVGINILAYCGNGICETGEDCSSCSADCGICPISPPGGDAAAGGGGGGGGGGGIAIKPINFKFEPDLIQEKLFQGDSISKSIKIINLGTKGLEVKLEVLDLNTLVLLNKNVVVLKKDETKEFEAFISINENMEPKVYLGNIIGTAGGVEKKLPIVLRVREKNALFVLDVKIIKDEKIIGSTGINLSEVSKEIIYPGGKVVGEITILNNFGDIQVPIHYSIKDRSENTLLNEEDLVKLTRGENVFIKEFIMPKNIENGYYLFYANFVYDEVEYIDAATFKVESGMQIPGIFAGYSIYILMILFTIILLLVIYLVVKKTRKIVPVVKKKEIIKVVNRPRLIAMTLVKIKKLEMELNKRYDKKIVEEYFTIMRHFFSDYYSLKSSLTFEELVKELVKKDIQRNKTIIIFINKISHIPYYKTLITKEKFSKLLKETLTFINSYSLNKPKKEKTLIKKTKKGIKQ